MKLKLWVAFGSLITAALGAQAQQNSRTPDPADPSATVPASVYASAMTGYTPAMRDAAPPPDKNWRPANDAVAGQSAHAGHGPAPAHTGHGPAPAHAGHGSVPAHAGHAPAPAPTQAPRRDAPAPAAVEHHKHH